MLVSLLPAAARLAALAAIAAARLAALAAIAAALPPGPVAVAAEATNQQLEAIEQEIEADRDKASSLEHRADDLALQIRALHTNSISIARKTQDLETRLSALEREMVELERQEAAKVADLRSRRAQLGTTLGALQRIALQPVDVFVVAPSAPIDAARSAMLLRVAIPTIERRAAVLRTELDDLTALRRRIALQRDHLAGAARALDSERSRLSALIRDKRRRHSTVTTEQRAAAESAERLAAQAEDLRDLLDSIERQARVRAKDTARQAREEQPAPARPTSNPAQARTALARPENIRPFPTSPASLVLPARGRIVVLYGQKQDDNTVSKGITIVAREDAHVVAPYDGKVVYAGEFRGYGQILIIEHDARYHTLLAGLDRVDAVVGQWLLAGEPVGVLGVEDDGHSELYLELRRTGQPINPLPWLATAVDKVRG